MFCNKCGTEIKEGQQFCSKCGSNAGKKIDFDDIKNVASEKLQEGVSSFQEQTEAYQAKRKEELGYEKIDNTESIFVDSTEEQIAVLGSGYLSNFVHGGELTKGFGIVTDKRFYFRGKCFYKVGGHYLKSNEERTIDLQDITASGFVHHQNIFLLVLSIISSVSELILIGVGGGELFLNTILLSVLWLLYFLSRKCIYEIQYAGGGIVVRASKYGMKETRAFDKELRRAKDKSLNRG